MITIKAGHRYMAPCGMSVTIAGQVENKPGWFYSHAGNWYTRRGRLVCSMAAPGKYRVAEQFGRLREIF